MFDYTTANRAQIGAEARTLVGKRLIDLDPSAPMVPSSPQNKGAVGRIYEAAFGIEPNSRREADFPAAGIELKSVPIRLVGGEARAKERVSLTMIDYKSLPTEHWETAAIRKKLDDLLLIFYRWDPLLPIARFETLAAEIWRPDAESIRQIRLDWEAVQRLVIQGRTGEVSEGGTRLLGAATKGRGHGSTTRAWSLKQTFVAYIYRSLTTPTPMATTSGVDPATAFEREVLARVEPFIGRTLTDLASHVGRSTTGKAAVAQTVRALLGQRGTGRAGEFERFGIETKIVPINRAARVVEAMSFPAFVHEELAYETWEASDLLSRLQRMLIVPVYRERRADTAAMRLGRPFFWSPSPAELEGIGREWEAMRSAIDRGEAARLPKASETKYIHVRPKARDARDRDPAPGGIDVIKKSFWLNQRFLERVLRDHGALTPSPPR